MRKEMYEIADALPTTRITKQKRKSQPVKIVVL